jgi:hypothetical protein
MWKLKVAYIVPFVLSAMSDISNKFNVSLKLLKLCRGLYILMKKVVINTCHIIRKFEAEQ